MLNTGFRTTAFLAFALTAGGAFAQGKIHTDVATAEKLASESGRPILALAGKKT